MRTQLTAEQLVQLEIDNAVSNKWLPEGKAEAAKKLLASGDRAGYEKLLNMPKPAPKKQEVKA